MKNQDTKFAKYVLAWFTIIVIFTSATTTKERSQDGGETRIYVHGGRKVRPGEFPFLVMLLGSVTTVNGTERKRLCSGSIPSPTTVLTCAHCAANNITVYAGLININETESRKGSVQVRNVAAVKPFTEFYILHDIMICYVSQPWVWSGVVAPVSLQLNKTSLTPLTVLSCQVMGFGMSEPGCKGGVAHVMDQLITNDVSHCIEFPGKYDMILCSTDVKDKTTCPGDSGGPVMYGGQQWGVIEGGKPVVEDQDPCKPPLYVNQYQNVPFYREWILENIKDLSFKPASASHCTQKISKYEVLLYPLLSLLLLMTVELRYLH